jgi:hypothetical protein
MQILSPAEQRAFDTPPLMNAADRVSELPETARFDLGLPSTYFELARWL